MTTTTHNTVTTGPAATGPESRGMDSDAYFRRLLGQRRLFGQLAECQRSHHGENTNTAMLESLVTLLTDELDIRFPDQWRPIEPDLLVAELRLQHDPDDGYMIGCGICHTAKQAERERRGRTTTQQAPRTSAGRRNVTPTIAVGGSDTEREVA